MAYPEAKQTLYLFSFVIIASIILFSSCATVRNYPSNKPFVYKTNIDLQGKFTTDEKKVLLNRLGEQLHDSIRVRRVQKLIF